MKEIGWRVEKLNGCQIFIRRFPLIGSFIKIQRPNFPIPFKEIAKLAKKYRAFKIIIEPRREITNKWQVLKARFKKYGYKYTNHPYLPTKTIYIDLIKKEKEIFQRFSEAKRRGVRRAIKNGVVVKESDDIQSFIKLKSGQFPLLGILTKKEIKALWEAFSPKNALLLEARSSSDMLGGVLLIFHQGASHYWLAAATKEGKKLFAPTLLAWEAIKISKKRGCKIFDFEGIYDPRFHKATKTWKGFTRFKRGFGGKEIHYPGSFVKYRFPF